MHLGTPQVPDAVQFNLGTNTWRPNQRPRHVLTENLRLMGRRKLCLYISAFGTALRPYQVPGTNYRLMLDRLARLLRQSFVGYPTHTAPIASREHWIQQASSSCRVFPRRAVALRECSAKSVQGQGVSKEKEETQTSGLIDGVRVRVWVASYLSFPDIKPRYRHA